MSRLPTIDVQILEELHRHDVLIPLFRVDLAGGNPERVVNLAQSLTAKNAHTTFIGELYRGAAEGRVVDPAIDGFQPWPTERRRNSWPSVGACYLYSRHQILGLDVAMSFLASLTPELSGEQVVWHLADAKGLDQSARDVLNSWRSLAITLSALDTYGHH